ncbi:MAG: hypothetical protein EZS28_002996 [Streblomastix strix]|uniref:Uncharacterized protein n=1 Tax=Streblomastix strix TaxID=222440 RepID=A0A5J4X2P7_9EUKA|nr:MAG: hypothetical protein EZS28_002996 [Streblomastix strix]
MAWRINNQQQHPDDCSNEEAGSLQVEGIRMRAEIQFDQYFNTIQMESDEEKDYIYSQAPNSFDNEDSIDMQASGDEEILNQQFQPLRRKHDQLEDLTESETANEKEEVECQSIQRRRLKDCDEESSKENSKAEIDSLSTYDPEMASSRRYLKNFLVQLKEKEILNMKSWQRIWQLLSKHKLKLQEQYFKSEKKKYQKEFLILSNQQQGLQLKHNPQENKTCGQVMINSIITENPHQQFQHRMTRKNQKKVEQLVHETMEEVDDFLDQQVFKRKKIELTRKRKISIQQFQFKQMKPQLIRSIITFITII